MLTTKTVLKKIPHLLEVILSNVYCFNNYIKIMIFFYYVKLNPQKHLQNIVCAIFSYLMTNLKVVHPKSTTSGLIGNNCKNSFILFM